MIPRALTMGIAHPGVAFDRDAGHGFTQGGCNRQGLDRSDDLRFARFLLQSVAAKVTWLLDESAARSAGWCEMMSVRSNSSTKNRLFRIL